MQGATSVTDKLLAALALYGLPVLCAVILVASIGVPLLPVSLMLVVAGSLAKQGHPALSTLLISGTATAILGDHIAYGLGRWGGRRLVDRVTLKIGGDDKIRKAEDLSRRWGAVGIFFSRWLVTELCPWISMASGLTRYPYGRFLFLVVSGEVIWVSMYVLLGYLSSFQIQYVAVLIGYQGRVVMALLVALLLIWRVISYFRQRSPAESITSDLP